MFDDLEGQKVTVYRNLNKPGIQFSIKQKGKVIGYRKTVILNDAKFKHPTIGALKRIRAKHREVCCWINGYITSEINAKDLALSKVLKSDPKKYDTFQDTEGKTLEGAKTVFLTQEGAFYFKPIYKTEQQCTTTDTPTKTPQSK